MSATHLPRYEHRLPGATVSATTENDWYKGLILGSEGVEFHVNDLVPNNFARPWWDVPVTLMPTTHAETGTLVYRYVHRNDGVVDAGYQETLQEIALRTVETATDMKIAVTLGSYTLHYKAGGVPMPAAGAAATVLRLNCGALRRTPLTDGSHLVVTVTGTLLTWRRTSCTAYVRRTMVP